MQAQFGSQFPGIDVLLRKPGVLAVCALILLFRWHLYYYRGMVKVAIARRNRQAAKNPGTYDAVWSEVACALN